MPVDQHLVSGDDPYSFTEAALGDALRSMGASDYSLSADYAPWCCQNSSTEISLYSSFSFLQLWRIPRWASSTWQNLSETTPPSTNSSAGAIIDSSATQGQNCRLEFRGSVGDWRECADNVDGVQVYTDYYWFGNSSGSCGQIASKYYMKWVVVSGDDTNLGHYTGWNSNTYLVLGTGYNLWLTYWAGAGAANEVVLDLTIAEDAFGVGASTRRFRMKNLGV